ncbi:protein-export chaperone SecB [bacterium AH-315-P15]|nr:protein-export chaperone SecB [bacterium AH-315-P15]
MSDTHPGVGADGADGQEGGQNSGQNSGQGDGQGGTFRVMTQYVKDLSFESPNAPQSLGTGLPQPAIDILVDVLPRKVGKEQYEVTLQMTAKATRGEKVVFIAELMYAGLFSITGVSQEGLQPLLLIEAPRFLFPFARRLVSDMTRDGGFPPLALDYMDFNQIYRQQLAKRQAEEAGDGASDEAAAPSEGSA